MTVLGIDPGLAHAGLAVYSTLRGRFVDARLLCTSRGQHRYLYRDYLARTQFLARKIGDAVDLHFVQLAVAEIPTGGFKSAKAAMAMGICIGLVAGLECRVVALSPADVKKWANPKTAGPVPKTEVEKAVRSRFNLSGLKIPSGAVREHIFDAIACVAVWLDGVQGQKPQTDEQAGNSKAAVLRAP